jgi:hypothetical protein
MIVVDDALLVSRNYGLLMAVCFVSLCRVRTAPRRALVVYPRIKSSVVRINKYPIANRQFARSAVVSLVDNLGDRNRVPSPSIVKVKGTVPGRSVWAQI